MYRKRTSNASDWVDFILVNLLAATVHMLIALSGCGTCVGNPECTPEAQGDGLFTPTKADQFQAVIDQYGALGASVADCGSFTEDSAVADVDAGRACIRERLEDCAPARYLLDRTTGEGPRSVSFVGVEASGTPGLCRLRVHTVSDDPLLILGDHEEVCFESPPEEVLELACGIGKR
jgi:hypothetical protein